jgi:O-6-methylguanine DNA methyltransferase
MFSSGAIDARFKKKKATFRDLVFAVVANIPKGSVLTYGEVALRAGSPGAARAVGNILSTNHDPKIPCHRVIRSDGIVGNYNRGGPTVKHAILRNEGAI